MMFLEQSTTPTICLGPFIDDTDGKTAETGLTTARTYIYLSKNGGDLTQKTETTALAHDLIGHYHCLLDATDTGTLGRLRVAVHLAGSLPVWQDYMVLTHDAYQSLCGDHVVGAAAVSDIHTDVGTAITDIAAVHTHVGTIDTNVSTVDTAVDGIATEVTLVHAHVAEWVDGARLDLLLDTAAAGGGLDAAAVRTAVGLATANLDTQLSALPTDADMQTASTAALNAYDPPTRSEATTDKAAVIAALPAAAPLAAANASAVRSELATELGRVDVATSTRLATSGYAAPPSVAALATEANATANKNTIVAAIPAAAPDAAAVNAACDTAISDAALATATNLAEVDTVVDGIAADIGVSSGSITWTYTLTEADTTPIAAADIWVTTDSGGSNVVANGVTDNFGVVIFHLDAGTYYVWAQKAGWTFTNPDTETVVAP